MVSILSKHAGAQPGAVNGDEHPVQVQVGSVAERPLSKHGHATSPPRIWGLSVQQLHDAFWASRGVQCVRLGKRDQIEAADLYLLLQPDQLAIFDLDVLLNRLIWQGASVTAVHIVDEDDVYQEAAVTDDAGNLQRIERHYGPACNVRGRVLITDRANIAAAWADAQRRRDWHRRLRCMFPAPLIARLQCLGRTCHGEDVEEGVQFLTDLVERWPDPERILEGVEALQDGVRIRRGDPWPSTKVVGPVWIGARSSPLNGVPCIVGPLCLPDQPSDGYETGAVRIRSSRDVDATPPKCTLKRGVHRGGTERRVMRTSLYPLAKRALDITVSATVLLLLTPVMAIIATAIAMSDGVPILFRHRRQSLHGRPFDCLKFRTMYKNAEQMVGDLRARNLCDGPQVHIEDDPRVTSVGRILRTLHLDELPQLWNVLVGDMSLVGPRPSPDGENRICPAWRELRLSVRPGITGLWQINRTRKPGRDFQEWIRYDVEYVRTAGFWLDLRICMRTAMMIFCGRRGK